MQTTSRTRLLAVFWLVVSLLPSTLAAQQSQGAQAPFEYSLADSVRVGQFEVRKAQDLKTALWHVEIYRDSARLFRSSNGAKTREDLLLGSYPLLGDDSKQLLIEEYTGEAFCCTYNYVLRVGESLEVLYSSAQYPVGYGLVPQDLNGDGVFELMTTLTRFDNFFNLPHEESPSVTVVFRYDEKLRRYVVGNREFADAILGDIANQNARVSELAGQKEASMGQSTAAARAWRSTYTGAVLSVGLSYLYAGNQAEGWKYFLENYDLDDRDVLLANLRYYLLRCPVFRGVYKDVQEILRSSMQTNE